MDTFYSFPQSAACALRPHEALGKPRAYVCKIKHDLQLSKVVYLWTQKNKICLLRSFSFPPAPIAWTCPELIEHEQHFGIKHQFSA